MRYLLIDIGSTFTKVCLADPEQPAVLAREQAPTTIADDVNRGIEAAREKLAGMLTGNERTLVCSSAAGGLKIVAVGLVPELTLQAARLAALGAGGRVLKAYAYQLTADDVAEIRILKPDLLILAGGTDGGNSEYIIENAKTIVRDLPGIPVVAAGNRQTYDELKTVFPADAGVRYTENVMPEFGKINTLPARECIRELFLKRIVRAKGLEKLRHDAQVVLPTPLAVHRAAVLLADGTNGGNGAGELAVLDMGGATTDAVTVGEGLPSSPAVALKGLPDPREKRTVEGDIGMRYSLDSLVERIGEHRLLPDGEMSAVRAWAGRLEENKHLLPSAADEKNLETLIAGLGCRLALERHCGRLETAYTAQGEVKVQHGKDCSGFASLVGTGGVLASGSDPEAVLRSALAGTDPDILRPVDPACLVDKEYIMWAMGLLAEEEPGAALKIMKRKII